MRRGRGGVLERFAIPTALAFVLAIVLQTPARAVGGNASIDLSKTVDSATTGAVLTLTLSVDRTSAIPGDTLTYTAVVANSGATLTLSGSFRAASGADVQGTIAAYYDEIEYKSAGNLWVPLAGVQAAAPGWTMAQPSPATTGLKLTALPQPATGVTYPTAVDQILGTVLAPAAVASWSYTAVATLTPAQALAAAPSSGMRNVVHFEVTPRDPALGQPYVSRADLVDPFTGNPAASAARSVAVTIAPPSGPATVVDQTTQPALASIASGGSVALTSTYRVRVPAAKGALESDSDYAARLRALEGASLAASATAAAATSATAAAGPVVTTEHLPLVGIQKGGPATVDAGTNETNALALQNAGGASASHLVVADGVPSGGAGTVSGVPATLAAGASATASALYAVPAAQPAGSLTDTASVSWQDANGNAYGPVSSSFTTTVRTSLSGATLALAPSAAGPDPLGTTQTLAATLTAADGTPIAGQTITLTLTGPNAGQLSATTGANGVAAFSYAGAHQGVDQAQATLVAPGLTLASNTASVAWLAFLQPVTVTPVTGTFFHEDPSAATFVAKPTDTPDFTQSFPTLDFDPPAGSIPHPRPGTVPNQLTRPFTDVTTDVNGDWNGTIVAQGNGKQAGVGTMAAFDAVFTGSYIVTQPGDVTFNLFVGDGFIFGVGNGASRVNGELTNPPDTSVFNGYPLIAAYNTLSSPAANRTATVHFPAAGTYPFEIDYFEAGGTDDLSLSVSVAQLVAQTDPLSIYVGYADGLRPGGSAFPFPWAGSPGVTFIGGGTFDAGALRFDNSGGTPIAFDFVTVDVDGAHYDLWPRNLVVPPQQTLILTQTGSFNFDTSDVAAGCGGNNGLIPQVHVSRGGVVTTYADTHQILNTGGFDLACVRNESTPWQRIAGSASTVNVPVPPAATLTLSPSSIVAATQGQSVTLTVAAMDGSGAALANQPVSLQIFGANAGTLAAATDASGLARFTYAGAFAGSDSLQASGFYVGQRLISDQASVTWVTPGASPSNPSPAPAPTILAPAPADGSVVTKPVAVSATITPPAGTTIASWRVFYQALDPGPQVTIGSGSGTPPATLATFDPTLVPNDTYAITVEATTAAGGVQDVSTTVTVVGNLKPGRFTATYQDLVATVGGFQMAVRRTYDSIDKSAGDFGVGWKVSLANYRVAANRILGAGGWTQYDTACFIGLCFTAYRDSAPRFVTVTGPDQRTEEFDFTPKGGTNIFWDCTPAFTARPGTTSTLAPLDDTSCAYFADGNLYGAGGQPYAPHRFQLTTRDGRVLVLDGAVGLVSERDANGNGLNVDPTGIHSFIGTSAGPSITFLRDARGRITEVDGPLAGQRLLYAYGATANELVTYTDALGHVFTYSYDATTGNLDLSADPNGAPLQTLTYDANGRLVSIGNGSQPATRISTAADLHSQAILDPNGALTTILTSDDLGDIVEEDQSFGGQVLRSLYTYDALGRMTTATDPDGNTIRATYDESATAANGNVLSFTDGAGRTWALEGYNAHGEPGLIRRPDGAILLSFVYDAAGRVLSTQRPGENPTSFAYAASGALVSQTDPGGRTLSYTYDANGRVASIGTTRGTLVLTRDAAGNLLQVTDPAGAATRYQYNADGTLALVTDARAAQWQYSYDALGRLVKEQDPAGHATTYAYSDLGEVVSRTDRNGAVTTYAYDVDGQLVREVRPGNDAVTFTYDPLGRVVEADNVSSHVDRTYDAASFLTSETTCANTGASRTPCVPATGGAQPSVRLSFTYAADGQPLAVTSSDAGAVAYAYDGLGRLTRVTDASNGAFGLAYDALGRLATLTRPNGVSDAIGYSASSDVTSRLSTLQSTGATLASWSYQRDAGDGRILGTTDLGGTHAYTYAANGRLLTATHPAASGLANEAYTYDAAGNRTSANGAAATFDAANRLLSDGTYAYTYDAEGDLVSRRSLATGGTTAYVWDADHELLAVRNPDGSASTYRYDPFGRRNAAVDPQGERRFVWDGTNVHAEYDGTNALVASYVHALGVDAPLELVTGSGARLFYVLDEQGSARALTDASGAVAGTFSYDSYGVPGAGSAAQDRFTYTGYQYDRASGLYYAGLRYYDPHAGRFLSEDPLPTAYRYPLAADDPVNLVDVMGADAAAEYAELLSDDVDNAQCVAGAVDAIASASLDAAAEALAGGVPTAGAVDAAIVEGLTENAAQCGISAAAKLRGTNKRGMLTSRPKFRKGTQESMWNGAKVGPSGGRLCPRCGREAMVPPGSGVPRDWHGNHYDPWSKREFDPNVTRQQVIDNYQQGVELLCPQCNLKAGAGG